MVKSQYISHSHKIWGEAGWGGSLLAGLLVGGYCLALRRYGLELADEGTLLAQIDRVAQGQVPYRDFHTGYGPALFYTNAGLFAAMGASLATVRHGLVVIQALRAALLVRLAGRIGPPGWWVASAVVLIAFFLPIAPGICAPLFVPYASWYADALGLLALWQLAKSPSRGGYVVVGLLWGAAFAFKQNTGLLGVGAAAVAILLVSKGGGGRLLGGLLGLALVAGGLALLRAHLDPQLAVVMLVPLVILGVATVRARSGTTTMADLVALAAGFAAVAIPVVGIMAFAAGMSPVATDLLQIGTDTALVYYVPYPALGSLRDAFAGSPGALRALRQMVDLSWFAIFPLVHLGAAVLLLRRRVATRAGIVVASAAIVGYLQLYPRMDGWHLFAIAPASLATCGILLATCGPVLRRTVVAALVLASFGRALPVVPVIGALAAGSDQPPSVARVDLRWDLLGPEELRRLPDVIQAVQGRGSVVGFPALGIINFAIDAPSPLRHDYFFPGRPTAAEEDVIAAELRVHPPSTVVLLDAPTGFVLDAFAAHLPVVVALRDRFVVEREIGPYRILVPRGGS